MNFAYQSKHIWTKEIMNRKKKKNNTFYVLSYFFFRVSDIRYPSVPVSSFPTHAIRK